MTLGELWRRLRFWNRRDSLDRELAAELGDHLELLTRDFEQSGLPLRPLPFSHEDRLITLCEQYPGAPNDWCSVSPPNIEDIAARSRSIEAIGIGRGWPVHLTTPEGAHSVQSGIASPGLFDALGVGVVRTTAAPASLATEIRACVKEVDGEIGIRLAIGAQRVQIVSGILSNGLRLAGMGIAAGLLAFLALGPWIAALAPGVSIHDPFTLSATALVLIAVATVACMVPAMRAGRVNPAMTLGAE